MSAENTSTHTTTTPPGESLPSNYVIDKVDTLYSTKWLRFKTVQFRDRQGIARSWDYVERTTRVSDIDGVDILAEIRFKNGPSKVVLVLQYRPPIRSLSLEFPAGLLDKGETAEQAALRELKEETGYCGEVQNVSPILTLEPGLTNANFRLVHVIVDGDKQENKNPLQQLEDEEDIELVIVPWDKLFVTIVEIAQQKNCKIDGKLLTFAYANYLATLMK